jgi:hypothetical protein
LAFPGSPRLLLLALTFINLYFSNACSTTFLGRSEPVLAGIPRGIKAAWLYWFARCRGGVFCARLAMQQQACDKALQRTIHQAGPWLRSPRSPRYHAPQGKEWATVCVVCRSRQHGAPLFRSRSASFRGTARKAQTRCARLGRFGRCGMVNERGNDVLRTLQSVHFMRKTASFGPF